MAMRGLVRSLSHSPTERTSHPRVDPNAPCIKSESPRRSSHFEVRSNGLEAVGGGRRRRSLREVFTAARRGSLTASRPTSTARGRTSLCVQVQEEDADGDQVAAAALGNIPMLTEILHNTAGDPFSLESFTAFSRQTFTEENVQFWLDVERFRAEPHTSDVAYLKDAAHLYALYLRPGSEREVNISSAVRAATLQNMSGAAAALASKKCTSPSSSMAVQAAALSFGGGQQQLLQVSVAPTIAGSPAAAAKAARDAAAAAAAATVADSTPAAAATTSNSSSSSTDATARSGDDATLFVVMEDAEGEVSSSTHSTATAASSRHSKRISADSSCVSDAGDDSAACSEDAHARSKERSCSDATTELSPAHSSSAAEEDPSEAPADSVDDAQFHDTASDAVDSISLQDIDADIEAALSAAAAGTELDSCRSRRVCTEEFFDAKSTLTEPLQLQLDNDVDNDIDSEPELKQATGDHTGPVADVDVRCSSLDSSSDSATAGLTAGVSSEAQAAAAVAAAPAVSPQHSSKLSSSRYFCAGTPILKDKVPQDALDHSIFDAAQSSVFQLILRDAYPKYVEMHQKRLRLFLEGQGTKEPEAARVVQGLVDREKNKLHETMASGKDFAAGREKIWVTSPTGQKIEVIM